MRTALIALTACSGHHAVEPRPNPTTPTSCTIRDVKVDSIGAIHLAVDGVPFAKFPGNRFVELEATFAQGVPMVRAATESAVLTGELASAQLVRPRTRVPIDGWLLVDTALVTEVLGSSLRLEVQLPVGIEPRQTAIVQPCGELTFARAPVRTAEGTSLELAGGTAELRDAPRGKVLAHVAAADDLAIVELARRDGWARVRISHPNAVEGWLPATAVRAPDEDGDIYGGLIGDEIGETGESYLRCRTAVAIHVRSRGKKVRVGAVVPGADLKIGLTKEDGAFSLDLGATELTPFVEDYQECDILVK